MHIHFVTGRLAEPALRNVVDALAPQVGFTYSIDVLNITVAALMTPAWIAERISVPNEATAVMLPGYCSGDMQPLQNKTATPVTLGPKDLRRLPEHFGRQEMITDVRPDIEIIAEINHIARLTGEQVISQAKLLAADGADVIDLGCDPGEFCANIADHVRALRELGFRVSVDSLEIAQIAPAVEAGAELVLSVNSSNRAAAADWGCEVVAIPDTPHDLASLDGTIEFLDQHKIRFRLDPILEPIGFGFANSLQRYHATRQKYPRLEMMMGIGNLTELTDADSAAINVLLLGYCQELEIRSVLTTQVVNWARSSVRECDLARRLVAYAVQQKSLPKHREPRLVPLRGEAPKEFGADVLDQLATDLKDNNYRIFSENGTLHLIWAGHHLQETDPFKLFAALMATQPKNVDANHAFYLGYELAKATTALTLNKQYEQDESLDWGYLTRVEEHHRLARAKTKRVENEIPTNDQKNSTDDNSATGAS